VPVYLDAVGNTRALNTVTVRAQVGGQIVKVAFREGQDVKRGDVLAEIDPRTYQAQLDQAVAKKAQDQAQVIAAQKDLDRFKTLVAKAAETQQNVDQQQGKVDQLKATIDADQAAIESAQTQLSYTTITAPIDGRVGFRQVDAGNIIHANDVNPLTVLTQIRPSIAIFTLPQKNLADVRDAMLRGGVQVIAMDQDNTRQLAQGEMMLIDNQIDQTTSTIRLKASFANDDDRLWPGEFVRLRVHVDTRDGAVTIPPTSVQRGPQGLYAWVIKPDNTAEQRPIEAMPIDSDITIVTKGLTVGERVVVNGQYRLQAGTRVESKSGQASAAVLKTDEAP
jgi:multidrug efflux system membrane fusion protein